MLLVELLEVQALPETGKTRSLKVPAVVPRASKAASGRPQQAVVDHAPVKDPA